MSKGEAKKDFLLCRGLEVMKAKGYNGTSVKDIVDAAGVPKGSFYNYFDSKEAFAVEAIEKVAADSYRDSLALLGDQQVPPLERLQRFFLANAESACAEEFKVGCFLGNMCQEMASNCEAIRVTTNKALGNTTSLIDKVLTQAQQQGGIDKQTDTKAMSEFLFNAWEGALIRMKASKSRAPLDAFLAMLPAVYNA